ncbi:MAG: hypothetical protein U5R48_15580 [Gammaproteobacteria bacterium]|nr:hypothetical protein [Gammaproteobacteria bacterium]
MHYEINGSDINEPAFAADDSQLVEIEPIPAETQQEWMQGFANQNDLPPNTLAEVQRLLREPYESKQNHVFAKLLGQHSDQWKATRNETRNTHRSRMGTTKPRANRPTVAALRGQREASGAEDEPGSRNRRDAVRSTSYG